MQVVVAPQIALWRLSGELVPVEWPPNGIPLKGFGFVHFELIVAAGWSLPYK